MPLGGYREHQGDTPIGRGIPIAGVPVGDAAYINAFLGHRSNRMLSKIETVVTKLRDLHVQSLYTATMYCLAPMFQYWTQHCYPADVMHHARAVDNGVLAAITMCVGPGILDDDIAVRRLRLPARKFGGGVRSLADVAPAAFVGTFCRIAPLFDNSRNHDWHEVPGFFANAC